MAAIVRRAEAELECSSQVGADGSTCEFDYLVEYDAPRKIVGTTSRHGRRKRWLASATVLVGCFAPQSYDDPEDD